MRRRLQNVALAIAAVAVLVGVLELPALLSLVDYRAVFRTEAALATGKPWQNQRNRIDDELLWIHRPNQHITGTALGDMVEWLGIASDRSYPVDVRYDRNGFRNARDLDSAAIVLLGDSFLEWSIQAQTDLLGSVLERRLGVSVANLSQAAYGPQQERIVLTRYGLPLRPKVVVWAFFEGNDLSDVGRYQMWVRDWPAARRALDTFGDRSLVANAWRAVRAMRPRRRADAPEARRRACRVAAGPAAGATIYFAYAGQPLSARDVAHLATAESLIASARVEAARHGARLVLAFLPTKFRVYGDRCDYTPDAYGRTWVANDLPERIAAWSAAHGVPYLDFTPALRAAALRDGLLYFTDDGHWTARGHAVAAETLATFLRREGLLAPAARR